LRVGNDETEFQLWSLKHTDLCKYWTCCRLPRGLAGSTWRRGCKNGLSPPCAECKNFPH